MSKTYGHRAARMPRLAAAFVLLCTVALTASPVAAVAHHNATEKLGRGLAAMTTGFLEVPGNMVAETRARGAAEGIPLGFFKGLGMIVVREPVGLYETVTAPFPAPDGYRPIIQPEYPWSYFEEGRERRAEIDRPRESERMARREHR